MKKEHTVLVIFGATGDLATKKIFPALWNLFKLKHFTDHISIVGYARSDKSKDQFVGSFKKYCKVESSEDERLFSGFNEILSYYSGKYETESFVDFNTFMKSLCKGDKDNRIFYFALPPSVYQTVASLVRKHCHPVNGYARVVLEKPFGYDLSSALELNKILLGLYEEGEIYRIDHYLGKEMVQNILAIRFANSVISSLWNRNHISNILISFKEDIGTFGRGQYYDNSGVIRDIIQNHMIQVLSLLAMEQPASLSHNDLKNAKCHILKLVKPIDVNDVVVGQYVADPAASPTSTSSKGYKDDSLVPADSITPTYVNMVLYIDNDRWRGVPFILKAGKALKERKAEIRIQFKPMESKLFDREDMNEMVIRMQPDEAIYLKVELKVPGPGFELGTTELDLTYKDRHKEFKLQEAYEKLILDVINGSHMNFVRSDEVEESWKLFTPLLEHLHTNRVKPAEYVFGSRGPSQADVLNTKVGFKYNPSYKWKK